MTIGMATILVLLGAAGMLQRCSEKCCGDAVVVPLLRRCYHCRCTAPTAGRQAGPRRVFSGAIAAIFLATHTHRTEILQPCCRPAMVYGCQCRVDCCFLLITMDSSLAAAVCILQP